MMCEFGLQCAITDYTREEIAGGRLSSSCIDHAWVRSRRSLAAFLLTCKISDHYLIGVRLGANDVTRQCQNGGNRQLIVSRKLVSEKLKQINWTDLSNITCPLLLYEKLCSIFGSIYDSSKVQQPASRKRVSQPWINDTLKIMIKRRDRLFRRWKSKPKDMNLRLEYTKFRNKTNKYINAAKNKFRQEEIIKCQNNFRKIWNNINSWIGKQKISLDQVILKYLCKQNSCQSVCSTFGKIFTEEISNIKHNCDLKFLDRLSYVNESKVSLRFLNVSAHDVEKVIDKLSSEKAPGSDGIRVQDVKMVKKDISHIIANFINLCVTKGVYPDKLKVALIRPIFKQGSHMEYSNYRPIAILSVINKIVEKIIVGQISSFLEKHKIISHAQHGFRRGRSTATALTQFADDVNGSLNDRKQVVVVYLDFKKAFDTLDHCQLLQAMAECGIRGPLNNWLRAYLQNRSLQVVVDGTLGEAFRVTSGVPTGSVCGPVGYIMHVNSMCNVVKNCRIYMYADDTCLVYSDENLQNIQINIQEDLNSIIKWAHDNGIIINMSKTKCMHVYSPYNKNINAYPHIIGHSYDCIHRENMPCDCAELELVNKYKYLGLTIDHNMVWKAQVNSVCTKLRTILGKFHHLKYSLNKATMYTVYYALAESLLSYGLSVYGRTFKTYLDQIKQLQIRFMKILVSKKIKENCNQNYENLFAICSLLPVHEKVKLLIAVEHFENDQYKTVVHSHSKRVDSQLLHVPRTNNYYGRRTTQYLVPNIYNSLPAEFLKSELLTRNTFKNKLKKHFIKAL